MTRLASGYYADTRDLILPLLLAALGLVVAGAAAVALAWWAPVPVPGWLADRRARERGAAAVAVLVVALFAVLASRPLWMTAEGECQPIVGALQQSLGLEVEPCRTYDEQTVSWFAWYYGWPTTVLAVLGLALLARRVVRRRDLRLLVPVVAVLVLALVYFVESRIYPDQVWAMRRFLPVVIPGLLVSAGYLLHVMWRHRSDGRWGRIAGVAAVGLAVLVVAWPAVVTHPMWRVRTGVPQLDQVRAVCDRIGEDAAVVSLGRSSIGTYTQTMRSFCDVPTQAMAEPSPSRLARVRGNVAASGRTLYVIAEQARFVPYQAGAPADPGAFSTVSVTKWPERLESVPQSAHRYAVPLYLGEVNADGTVRPVR